VEGKKIIPIYKPPTIPPNLKGVDITTLSLSLSQVHDNILLVLYDE
jgi:hypothetical protein